jgi:hypothetical protein
VEHDVLANASLVAADGRRHPRDGRAEMLRSAVEVGGCSGADLAQAG